MTKEEYNKFKEEFNKQAERQHKENQDLINTKEHDIKAYHGHYMQEQILYSYNVHQEPVDGIMVELDDLRRKTNEFRDYPEFFLTLEGTAYNDYESATIDEVIFQATWEQPMSQGQLESAMKKRFKMELGEALRPNSVANNLSSIADCKAIQMYEAGELTWIGLQKMTYGQCDL